MKREELHGYLERTGARPFKALDAHLATINWLGTDLALELYERVEELAAETGERQIGEKYDVPRMVRNMRDGADRAQTIWVDPDKCTLIAEAMRTIQVDTLHETDLFVPAGYAYFAVPIPYVYDNFVLGAQRREESSIRAVLWYPTIVGTGDPTTNEIRQTAGVGFILFAESSRATPWRGPVGTLPIDYTSWAFETPIAWAVERRRHITMGNTHGDDQGDVADQEDFSDRQLLLALNRLMWQKITVGTKMPVPRTLARRAARMKRPADYGFVWIAHLRRLRRPPVDGETATSLEGRYDCRWIVHGFWRNQYYPTLGPAYLEDGSPNPGSHRMIWVDDFIKGPDHAPLRVGDRIFSLDR